MTLDFARFLPAAIALAALTVWLARHDDPAWRSFGGAATVFALGLVFHRTDTALCGPIPIGTHFLWHLCSGVTPFLITRELLERAVLVAGNTSAEKAAKLQVSISAAKHLFTGH